MSILTLFFKNAHFTNLWGHSLKQYNQNLRLHTRKYFFSHRVTDVKKLDIDIIACHTVSAFKRHLDNYVFNQGLI